jgi:hypothetical protein
VVLLEILVVLEEGAVLMGLTIVALMVEMEGSILAVEVVLVLPQDIIRVMVVLELL